jgi:hypothetical protein
MEGGGGWAKEGGGRKQGSHLLFYYALKKKGTVECLPGFKTHDPLAPSADMCPCLC